MKTNQNRRRDPDFRYGGVPIVLNTGAKPKLEGDLCIIADCEQTERQSHYLSLRNLHVRTVHTHQTSSLERNPHTREAN
jgi:hypothetical protein